MFEYAFQSQTHRRRAFATEPPLACCRDMPEVGPYAAELTEYAIWESALPKMIEENAYRRNTVRNGIRLIGNQPASRIEQLVVFLDRLG